MLIIVVAISVCFHTTPLGHVWRKGRGRGGFHVHCATLLVRDARARTRQALTILHKRGPGRLKKKSFSLPRPRVRSAPRHGCFHWGIVQCDRLLKPWRLLVIIIIHKFSIALFPAETRYRHSRSLCLSGKQVSGSRSCVRGELCRSPAVQQVTALCSMSAGVPAVRWTEASCFSRRPDILHYLWLQHSTWDCVYTGLWAFWRPFVRTYTIFECVIQLCLVVLRWPWAAEGML